jgi:hypothetical protein
MNQKRYKESGLIPDKQVLLWFKMQKKELKELSTKENNLY